MFAAASVLAIGQGLKFVIDRGFAAGNAAELDRMLAVMLAVIVVLALATYTRFYYVSWLGERVTADLRRAVFDHLLALPPGYFEVMRTGEVISRLTNDTTMLETVIGSSASMAVRNILLMVGGLVMLALTSAKLTLMVLVGVPLTVVPILLFGRRVRKLARASQDRVGDVGAYVDEALHEIRTVQAYGHEEEDRRQFGARVESAFATALQRIRQRAFLVATVILLVFGAVGVILWIGGHDVVAGRISAGQLSAFVFYAVIVASAVGTISEVVGDLQRAAGATERLFELLEVDAAIRAPANPTPLPVPARGTVAFRDVTFHYPSRPDAAALEDFSLDVAAGEKVALVGPSGAGKTTVFQLLLRFYDPQHGAVIDRRRRPARCRSRGRAQPPGGRAAGSGDLRGQRPGKRPLRPARRHGSGSARRVRRGVRHRIHRAHSRGLRQLPGRARRAPLRRPAAAHRDRARHPGGPAGAAAGRGDQRARCGKRAHGAAGAGAADGRAHGAHHRAPAGHRAPRRPHRRHGARPDHRHRQRTTRSRSPIRSMRGWRRCNSAQRPSGPANEEVAPDRPAALQ